MPRRRIKRHAQAAGRPSTFFIIALILGVVLLVWVAYTVVSRPMAPPKTRTAVTSVPA